MDVRVGTMCVAINSAVIIYRAEQIGDNPV